MSAVVAEADAVNPRLTVRWLDHAQHRGFATDRPGSVRRRTNRRSSGWCSTRRAVCATSPVANSSNRAK